MPYELLPDESPAAALSRIVRERLDKAIRCLRPAKGRRLSNRIHEARKRLKEARAALRLARPALDEERYRRENTAYRDAARPLSAVRDAAALVDAVGALVDHFRDDLRGDAFEATRAALGTRARRIRRRVIDEDGAARTVHAALRVARRRVATRPFRSSSHADLAAGLARTYRAGREAMKQACADGGDESHHEWRKQGKYLRYEAEILGPIAPQMMAATAKQAKKLARILGDDHDLAVLEKVATEELARDAAANEREALEALIDERRSRLQKRARRIGAKLYAEKPKAFERRVRRYLRERA